MIIVNKYFDINKKGKNTTKKEKIELYNNINDSNVKTALDKIFQIIYDYKLFEIDMDNFYKLKNEDDVLNKNFQKINLRVLKRLLNIFTFSDNNKIFKSNIETSLQYKILKYLIDNTDNSTKVSLVNSVEEMTIDLDKIWGF